MSATVTTYQTGSVRVVKNLGWLVRHRSQIVTSRFICNPAEHGRNRGGILVAMLNIDGRTVCYRTRYASLAVFRDFQTRLVGGVDTIIVTDPEQYSWHASQLARDLNPA